MPRKRSQGQKKKSGKSQPKSSASTPSVSASTVKPAQQEKGAASSSAAGVAAKPATTTAPAAKTSSSVLSTSTASTAAASSVTNIGATTGPKASGGVTTTTGSPKSTITKESPKVAAQAPPVSPAKAPPVSAGTTGAVGGAGKTPIEVPKPKETPKVQEPKVPSKVTSTVTKPTATTVLSGTAKEAKVKSEVSAKASTPAPDVDPFDALAGSLPSAEPPKPTHFTGPEVQEHDVTADVAQRCGERDDTLPPGYRLKDMEKKTPSVQPEKPKEVSKPITSDEALESLSAGFESSPPPAASKPEVKHETVAAAATHKSFSPAPPVQKAQAASVPADLSPAPPADKKPRVEKVTVSPDKTKKDPKADPMSLDVLDALAETLPEDKPAPEAPKLKPEQIVDEKKQKSEKGVRVGEREDTIPPEYRFKEDKDAKPIPPSPKKPPMDQADALDFLDFTDATAAPAVHSAAAPPKAQAKQPKVEDISALEALESDFVAPDHAKKVCSGAPPVPTPAAQSTSDQGDMSLEALDALGDMLPEAKPVPESPKLRPEDAISEPKLQSEKGVRVGERDDTIPPEYRFPKDDPKSQPPPPKKEPSLDTNEALDILSGGFDSSSTTAPKVQSQTPPSAPPATSSSDFTLDALSDDTVSVSSASKVCSSAPAPPTTDQGDMSLEALDALGDMLPEAKPVPESPKLRPEDAISEPKLQSEKGVRVGERDDTIPPEYRFPKDDPKSQPPPPKKEPSLDTNEALDILSEGFDSSSTTAPKVQSQTPPSAPPATSSGDFDLGQLEDDVVAPSSASKVCSAASAPTAIDRQMSDGATSAMDALSETLDDIRPAPAPAPVLPKNIVKEKDVVEERVHKAGETDDSLPPEYRPTEADIKAAAKGKAKAAAAVKKPSIDDSQALDILSGDFDSKVPVTPPAAQCQASAAASVKTSSSQKDSGPVLDKLADSLLPENFPVTKQSDSKPKKPAVADAPTAETLPAKPSKDVVSSTSVKKGGKS